MTIQHNRDGEENLKKQDGGDDENENANQQGEEMVGDYNMGDDIGERIGEGHDTVEDKM
jgi:hypothetical protein